MKLYMHPFSTASRPVRLLLTEHGIACEEVLVDIMSGEQRREPYLTLNPNAMVPMLEDGALRLTEGVAILQYLAARHGLAIYPQAAVERARVDERLAWFNSQFYRDFGYALVYPQIMAHHRRRSDEATEGTLAWGLAGSRRWLAVLDQHFLGGANPFVCGQQVSIADYFGAAVYSLGELIGFDDSAYPHAQAWMRRIKSLRSWACVNEAFDAGVARNAGRSFMLG